MAGDILQLANASNAQDFDLAEILPNSVPRARDEPVTLDLLDRSNPDVFEAIIAAVWQKQGYRCRLTPKSSDAGVDVVATGEADDLLIQCKSSSLAGHGLGWDAVKEVVGGSAV